MAVWVSVFVSLFCMDILRLISFFSTPLVYPCSYMIAALLLARKYFRDSAISLTLADISEWNCIDAVGKFDLWIAPSQKQPNMVRFYDISRSMLIFLCELYQVVSSFCKRRCLARQSDAWFTHVNVILLAVARWLISSAFQKNNGGSLEMR